MINSNYPTYNSSIFTVWFNDINGINPKNTMTVIVQFLDPVIIDNVLYKPRDWKNEPYKIRVYKLPFWIAKELCEMGYCVYSITPGDLIE